ncbi:hypothetical protein TMPK1_41230 [Rhodospirillales bacterium TMPK1]|uniref:Uncharacterized protein n=1 Tax=Roseiterribacter gracilis TaxID=2812848 RepID=A0A8S8XL41_9PROT|nr:hypothetical protein TMPK1_41230 [Rhodospirillales bacterium TMPK1]
MRLDQDLKPVAHAQDRHAALGRGAHFTHHGRMGGHGAASKIVTVTETAWQHDQIGFGQFGRMVPDGVRGAAHNERQRAHGIPVAIGTGEDDDGGLHDGREPRVVTESAQPQEAC